MENLIHRLRTRAMIRRQIPGRKSVQEGKPDRLADLLDEAACALENRDMLLKEIYEWTAYKDTPWAKQVREVLNESLLA